MEGRKRPGTVGDPALLFNRTLGKGLFTNLEDWIVPESVIPPGTKGDLSFQCAGKDLCAAFISVCNPGDKPGIAIRYTVHQLKDTGVADRIQDVCGIGAGKSLQCVDEEAGIVNDERGVQMAVCVLSFFQRALPALLVTMVIFRDTAPAGQSRVHGGSRPQPLRKFLYTLR
jgi:hypothetical protein